MCKQARVQGEIAGLAMSGELDELMGGVHFDLFAHMTRLWGFKVVLLGRFNGQGLGQEEVKAATTAVATAEGLRDDGAFAQLTDSNATTRGVPDGQLATVAASKVQVQYRVTPGVEYVKVVLRGGRVVGALLVGDTDLEETFENLILSGIDVSGLGFDLLDPDVDLEDFFD